MENRNMGLKVLVVILCVLVLGLGGYILYDKIVNNTLTEDEAIDNFVYEISMTEENLKNNNEYTVEYNDLVFQAYKHEEYNTIKNIVISYKGKQINKNLDSDIGFLTLNSYYFDEEDGLFILTFLQAPIASHDVNHIIAFDINGNIVLDDTTLDHVYIVENKNSLISVYQAPGGYSCDCFDSTKGGVSLDDVCSSVEFYRYYDNKIEKNYEIIKRFGDLPKCN
ncbi:MAG: hypothetical protein IJZ46_01450 [Bacilli bacterium]|nr:hypothetical protein [Bacilli bacterium]